MQQTKDEMIAQIEAGLPNDVASLKSFTIELLLANQLFQDRCKETIRQLIEEKHIALHKYRLLENAAGIRDQQTGVNFLSQLQYLQLENEQQAATIAYLKIQNRMLEASVTQQEDYYRRNLTDLTDQHQQELKIVNERSVEVEAKFMEMQKAFGEELVQLRQENTDLKLKVGSGKGSSLPAADTQFLLSVQTENNALQQRVKEMMAEKLSLSERLRSVEQLKSMHEAEITKYRNDLNLLRKTMQEAMTKVLSEAKTEADERDEGSGQIVFIRGENGSKQIKGATPEKLVERLTDPSTFDSQFQASFLLTFRSFMEPATFLQLLAKRFKDSQSANPTIAANIQSKQATQSPVQLRVCNTVKNWIENYWFDFQDDKNLLDKLNEFINYVRTHNEKLANVIRMPLARKMNGKEESLTTTVVVAEKKTALPRPKPIIPKAIAKRTSNAAQDLSNTSVTTLSKYGGDRPSSSVVPNWAGFNFGKLRLSDVRSEDLNLKLTDLEPLEVARQMTLVEFELFSNIRPTEFLNQAWMKADKEIKAPNICNMTKWSNHITRWVVTEIISIKDSPKTRAVIFERMIMIAQHLEKMNNFNGVKEVLAGLQSSAVYRLKKTREAVNSKYLKVFDDLVKLTSSELNFKNLRAKIHNADPPLLPFPGIYQGDLVFLDACSKDKLENGLINYSKHQKIASYILELEVYQQTPYNFEPVIEITDYIRNFTTMNDDEAYNDSLVCEPREPSNK
ncbi:hypothetical protein MIR68_008625 [Amoeboaphelidium protococcarum]|nr:hypothetical protein MIR68_008625 [Amoeboaphelidium protococcarum]KAI3644191.1 hypothetical protein MP228_010355 [Amoeboaphelidium protococcarum]